MNNTQSSTFRIAGGLLAGLTIGLTATHADPSHDATVDAADYVVWRKSNGTAVIGDPVTFSFTNSS